LIWLETVDYNSATTPYKPRKRVIHHRRVGNGRGSVTDLSTMYVSLRCICLAKIPQRNEHTPMKEKDEKQVMLRGGH
jgi:hypothetical protein